MKPYQVRKVSGENLNVLRNYQDVIVRPVESHGTGDEVVAVERRRAGVPPSHVLTLAAPVIAGPETSPDGLSVVDHVEAAGPGRGVAHDVGDQGRVHLQDVVTSQRELAVWDNINI